MWHPLLVLGSTSWSDVFRIRLDSRVRTAMADVISMYETLPSNSPHLTMHFAPGSEGPCLGMDTACSSSLVAIHLGHRALLNREATTSGVPIMMVSGRLCLSFQLSTHVFELDIAVLGGTNLMLVNSTFSHLSQLGALSKEGRSKTLDASADGYGRGEACIVFIAQPASSPQTPLAFLHGA